MTAGTEIWRLAPQEKKGQVYDIERQTADSPEGALPYESLAIPPRMTKPAAGGITSLRFARGTPCP